MSQLTYLDLPCLTWGQLVESTGIEPRQLRNAMDRGMLPIGRKRAGRMLFTIRERFAVDLVAALTSNWIPISVASTVARRIQSSLEIVQRFYTEVYQNASDSSYIDLWLDLSNAGSNEIAIGFRANFDEEWLKSDSAVPIVTGNLPAFFAISMMFLFERTLRFCVDHASADERISEDV